MSNGDITTKDWEVIYTSIDQMDTQDLNDIMDTIREREKYLKEQSIRKTMADLEIGDKVRIKRDAPLKPRYILGATGIVDSIRVTKIGVLLDKDIHDPYGKWAGRIAVIGAQHIEPVE